jgi:hypothetical protein
VEQELLILREHMSSPTLGSVVASLLAATLYQGNPDKKHKLWNIRCTGSDADDTDVKDVDKLVVMISLITSSTTYPRCLVQNIINIHKTKHQCFILK